MAKRLARQQGYSEAEINSYVKKLENKEDNVSFKGNNNKPVNRMPDSEGFDLRRFDILDSLNMLQEQVKSDIYGHDIFSNKNLNFTPSYNIPTPTNYKLGAGDEVILDIWGDVTNNIMATISPEGSINIDGVGPVYIAGKTIKNAENYVKNYLSRIHSGLSGPEPTVFAKLSLGKISSISVSVVGEVKKPGAYTIPSLSTIASALYLAEGPNDLGTVRDIRLYRNSKLVATFDVYDFLANGNTGGNSRLEDNDVIIVNPYNILVSLEGGAKRPMKYEVKENETIEDLLKYSGGFAYSAYTKEVYVKRKSGEDLLESFDIQEAGFKSFRFNNGDVINISSTTNTDNKNIVAIVGPVLRPGSYSLTNNGDNSLLGLIKKAGGLKEDAYLQRGYIQRLDEQRQKTQVNFNLQDVILGSQDVMLNRGDSVIVFTINDISPKKTIKVMGEVRTPGIIEYREGMSIGDVILASGGLTDAATLRNVEIARRIGTDKEDDRGALLSDTVAVIMKFNLLNNPSEANTALQPFDVVFIRKSSMYKSQTTVTIDGEIKYPGVYAIEKNVVRLSDIVNRANGFTKDAYLQGATLTRLLTDEEQTRLETAKDIVLQQSKDSTKSKLNDMEVGDRFSISIEIDKAVENPNSYYDVVLREGDIITIPKLNNTVTISGAVLYPNTVTYNPKYSWKDYLSNAGGVTQKGIQRKTYMVHMNGSVATKGRKNFKVQPGTEIIVPFKDEDKEGAQTLAQIIGLTSTTVSTAAMVMTLISRLK
jgi:Periplasmic protein involved in polysaccharide export